MLRRLSRRRILKQKKQTDREKIAPIKNSLAVILGNVELVLIEQEENLSAESRKWLKQIKNQVWKIDGLLAKPDFSPLGQKKDAGTGSYRHFHKAR